MRSIPTRSSGSAGRWFAGSRAAGCGRALSLGVSAGALARPAGPGARRHPAAEAGLDHGLATPEHAAFVAELAANGARPDDPTAIGHFSLPALSPQPDLITSPAALAIVPIGRARSARRAEQEQSREARAMNAADHPVWFVGDLDDPWVASLADALPAGTRRIACAGDLPDDWPGAARRLPRVVVVHRAWLSPRDAERLARLRAGSARRAGAAGDPLCRPARAACRPRALVRAGVDRCDRPRGDGARHDRAAPGRR